MRTWEREYGATALSNGVEVIENVGVSEVRNSSPTFSHLGPLAVWVGVQLFALGLAALQVPLADEMPRPVEGVAMGEMVIVQVSAAGMLFPVLFRNVGTTAALVASTWPFLQLASMLSGTPGGRVVSVGTYVAMWMVALALFNSVLRSERARLRGVAVSTSLVFTGPLLWYLHHEFNASGASPSAINVMISASPITGTLNVLNSENRSAGVWVLMSAMFGLALVGSIVMHWRRAARDKLSTIHPQGLSTGADSGRVF